MTVEWNPTDDNLRKIADAPYNPEQACARDLARLVLREREKLPMTVDAETTTLNLLVARAQENGYLMLAEVMAAVRDGRVEQPRPIARRWLEHEAFRSALVRAAVLAGWHARPDASKLTTEQCDAICAAATDAVLARLLAWANE